MGSHADCTSWDYEDHPDRTKVTARCDLLVRVMLDRPRRFDRYGYDTRPGHQFVFAGMCPADCSCIIGNYRGTSSCDALKAYGVRLNGPGADRRVGLPGVPPAFIPGLMHNFEQRCRQLCEAYEGYRNSATGKKAAPEVVRLRFATALAEVLEQIFLIHPYANGNGHMGRLLVVALLIRHGFKPTWSLDSRPPYDDALSQWRDGDRVPLTKVLLDGMR